jgi:hypothetical protein
MGRREGITELPADDVEPFEPFVLAANSGRSPPKNALPSPADSENSPLRAVAPWDDAPAVGADDPD